MKPFEPSCRIRSFLGAQSSVVTVSFLDDVLQESGIWLWRIEGRPATVNEAKTKVSPGFSPSWKQFL